MLWPWGKFEDREERAQPVRYCHHYRGQQSIGALPCQILAGYSLLFMIDILWLRRAKDLVSSAKYLTDYTLAVDTEIANPPK